MGWSRHIGHIVNRLREMGGYVPADEMSVLAEGLARFVQEQFQQLKEITMSVSAQVQTLVEAIAMQTQAISDAGTELAKVEQHAADLEGQVADLGAKLTAALATAPVAGLTDEDIAALTEATAKVTGSVAVLKAAMPAPVAPAAVQAASDAAAVVGGAA
jgi:chromosome segregation ATPase